VETKTIVSTGEKSEDKIKIDSGTYANITPSNVTYTLENGKQLTIAITKETETYFEYETELNDEKRNIILLRDEFVPAAMRELKTIFEINS
jgi:hypothetical protein